MNAAARSVILIVLLILISSTINSAFAQGIPEALTIGISIDREIKGGDTDSYSLDLQAGQLLYFTVEQTGIELTVRIFDQSGHKRSSFFGPETPGEPEDFNYVTTQSGKFRIDVLVEEKDAPAARYKIKLIDVRAATQKEKDEAVPGALLVDAESLYEEGTEDSLRAALRKYDDAIPLLAKLGDRLGEMNAVANVCTIYVRLGDPKKSLPFGQRALAMARELDEKNSEASILNTLGAVYNAVGDLRKSIETLQEALKLPAEALGTLERGTTLNNIATRYTELGEYQRAIDYFSQSLALARTGGNKSLEGRVLSNLGATYRLINDDKKALATNLEGLEFNRRIRDKGNEAVSLNNISAIYYDRQDFNGSIVYAELAIVKMRETGNRKDEMRAVNNLAISYSALGDTQKASELLMNILPYQRSVTDPFTEPLTLRNLAFFSQKQGDLRLAAFFGKQSVNGYQSVRSSLRSLGSATQKTFLKSIERGYRPVAEILIADGRLNEAFRALDLFKDQQYFDFNTTVSGQQIEFTPRETRLKAEFDDKIASVVEKIRNADGAKNAFAGRAATAAETENLRSAELDLAEANARYRDFLVSLKVQLNGALDASDTPPDFNDLRDLQAAVRETSAATGQPAVAIYTLVGESTYRALIITPDRVVEASSKIGGKELDAKIQQLWRLLQMSTYDPRPMSKEIYDIVFAPIADKLPKDTKTILWSLDGNLRYVPMSALYDGRQYLVERYNNVVFTRADKERMTRKQSDLAVGSGFGSSKALTVELLGEKFNASALPSVKTELDRIFGSGRRAGVLSGSVLLDKDFNRDSMLTALKSRRPLVHIASHFKFEPGNEARSFLLMGDGTPFTLDEMKTHADMFVGVDLLTLSACETAAQKPDANGREVDGFAELAQRLGAGAVMASLWKVSDNSTAELMSRFYANFRTVTGSNKASALRNAQLALLRGTYNTVNAAQRQVETEKSDKDVKLVAKAKRFSVSRTAPYAHPYYWSPFILIGNWR